MADYKSKYLKYKQKYLKLKGGAERPQDCGWVQMNRNMVYLYDDGWKDVEIQMRNNSGIRIRPIRDESIEEEDWMELDLNPSNLNNLRSQRPHSPDFYQSDWNDLRRTECYDK